MSLSSVRRRAALTVAAGVLGTAGSALAAGPALAYHINFGTNGSGGSAPIGTTYSMVASSPFEIVNSTGSPVWRCSSSSLSGTTSGSAGASSGLSVTGATFSGCLLVAVNAPTSFTPVFTTPWRLTPTGGGPSPTSPFTGTLTNVGISLSCGSNSETFGGTLGSGLTENNVAGGSDITFNNAQSLSLISSTGSGCGLPGPYGVSAVYTLSKVNGAAVTAANNLWLLQN